MFIGIKIYLNLKICISLATLTKYFKEVFTSATKGMY